jgi:hypothetical protein
VGVFDFLKPKSALEKASKQLREPYAQPDYRQGAMDKLFEIGTDEAYRELLKRFAFNANGAIADESEKRMLVDRLVEVGEPVVQPLKDFIRNEKAITFPIQALERILPAEEADAFLSETLSALDPQDHRTVQPKAILLVALSERLSGEQARIFVPYLSDHSDDVQYQCIEALQRLADPGTRDALIELCTSDLNAARIRRRAAQALATLAWPVKDRYDDFDPELRAEWGLNKQGVLVKKG